MLGERLGKIEWVTTEMWVQGIGLWYDAIGELGQQKLDGSAVRSPSLWRFARAREGRERVRVSVRESVRPHCLQRHPDHVTGLAPACGSHATATAYDWSATTPADSELHRVTDRATLCTYNS